MMVERNLSINQATAREYDFDQPVVSVGSHPDNDIILGGPDVLPFHATVVLEAGQYHLIPMETGALINVDGVRLQAPQVNLETTQRVEIGNNALFFQHNGTSSSMRIKLFPLAGEEEPPQYTLEGGEKAILLNVLSDESEVDVEQTAVFEFEVINAGPIVASFFVSLKGVPENWVEISPDTINLNEGQRHLVQIRITPPRDASSEAGTHTLRAYVISPNYTGQRVTADLSLTIHPYYQFAVGNLSPKDQRISWRKKTGKTFLPITNLGNGSADFNILAMDDENGISFDFRLDEERLLNRQANLQINAAETVELPIEITPIKHPMFSMRSKRYHYTTNVTIPQNAVAPQVISGSATSVPLFGWWSIVLGVAAILLALFFILQPNIRSFNVAAGKDVIELGDTTRLDWDVSPFATRLSITNIDPPITRGQVSQTVAPVVSTTYELVSGNWLSGMVGLDQKRSVTVLVVPPSPLVNVFEVDKTSISKGQPVNIRWSVSTADEVFLTIDEVVYPLTPEEFSGERQVVLEKDALITLEAKTGSGSELQSYFVNVVPPYININTFTIWVRPDGAAANPSSSSVALATGGKRFSMVNAPDPNFPVKFVELIPDVASDNGYRVFFNPDVRTELNKGEQVMLEWNVEGVDSLQIAPFTDQLPSRGSQPFFPQESMNFVMTATSGDLTGIFMLPVKVFDGIPPTAPKIEFFRGTPLKMVGGGEVELTWSISGEWTNVQLSNADGIIANNLNPVGFKKLPIKASSTIILTAFNGTLTSAMPLEITVDPALKPIGLIFDPDIPAYPPSGRFPINQEVSFTVRFYDPTLSDLTVDPPVYVEPVIKPTGEVFVTDGVSLCTIPLPTLACVLKLTTPGDPKKITASYLGDSIYLSATSDAPYNQYISVISSTVTLTPTYYLLDKTTPEDSPNVNPISINTAPLSLETGLFIRVKITPLGSPLPSPDAGKVNLYLCDQQAGEEALVPGTCNPYGFASVTLNGSNGLADIVLDSFPRTGNFALLLSYYSIGFEPSERIEYNVVIDPMIIYMSMAGCDPLPSATCGIGTSTPSATKVVFEIRKKSTAEKLSSDLVIPVLDAFEVYEIFGSTISPWNCQMAVVTSGGSNNRVLECTVDFTGSGGVDVRSPDQVYFRFDVTKETNYIVDPAQLDFDLTVKQNTLVSLVSGDFLNLKVGKLVALTTTVGTDGAVSLTSPTYQAITPTGQITVSAQQTGVFGAGLSSTGCVVDSSGQVVTITSITTECSIYFKKAGTFNLSVSYAGNDTNYRSNSAVSVSVTVGKQEEITFNWLYKNLAGTYVGWDLTSILNNSPLNMRIELGGPSGFSSSSLADGIIKITLNESTCSVSGSGITSAGGQAYNVPITNATIGQTPKADFTLTCTTLNKSVTISAELVNTTDFGLKADEVSSLLLGILSRDSRYINVSFIRQSGSTSMLTGTPPGTMGTLHFGEKYTLQLTVGRLYADSYITTRQDIINAYIAAQHKAIATFDPNIYASIDWTKSTCLNLGSNQVGVLLNNYNVVFDFQNPNLYSFGLTDIELYNSTPCVLYFDKVFTPVTAGSTIFSYAIKAPNSAYTFSYSRGPITTKLDKQTVSSTTNPGTYQAFVDSAASNVVLNFSTEISQSTLNPLNTGDTFINQFDPSPFTLACTSAASGAINTRVSGTLSLTPSSTACSGNISVIYKGNNYFKTYTATFPAAIILHNPNLAILYKNNPSGNWVPFDSPFNIKVGDKLELKLTANPTPGETSAFPTGLFHFWMVDVNGDKIDPTATTPIFSIDPSTTVVYLGSGAGPNQYEYSVAVNNTFHEALFNLNVLKSQTNLRLKYRYEGDTKFYGKPDEAGPFDFKP